MPSILDHPLLSSRVFFPRPDAPRAVYRVDCRGATLACWRSVDGPKRRTLVHFHGNGEVVADWLPWFADEVASRGLGLMLVEYRGYGESTGSPTIGSLLDDVECVFEDLGLAEDRLIAFGRSLGSYCALELVARHPGIAGLILESAIADPLERILVRVTPAELGTTPEALAAAVAQCLDHRKKIAAHRGPVLVLHAAHDHLVDHSHAGRLAEWAGKRARLVLFPDGDHSTILMANQEAYWAAIDAFLAQLSR